MLQSKRIRLTAKIFLLASLIFLNSKVQAAPFLPKEIKVLPTEITSVEVAYKYVNKNLLRIITCFQSKPGLTKIKSKIIYFRTLKDESKFISSQLKINARNKRKATQLQLQLGQIRALILASATACTSSLPPSTPGATPTAAPVPTQTIPSNSNFDLSGNVTEIGKVIFGIPVSLQANTLAGKTAELKYSCNGCHVSPGGYNYDRLKTAITTKDPMKTFGVSTQELVDLVAWFNRGRVSG